MRNKNSYFDRQARVRIVSEFQHASYTHNSMVPYALGAGACESHAKIVLIQSLLGKLISNQAIIDKV